LATVVLRLHNFQHVLPKLVHRRGLIDFGGAVLITLFGTAIFSDLNEFHEIFNELKLSQKHCSFYFKTGNLYKKVGCCDRREF
jgi:hypothetical protein